MKLFKFYVEDEQYDKLFAIGVEMEKRGLDVRDKRNKLISRAAVIRELINGFDLPAQPKGTPKK